MERPMDEMLQRAAGRIRAHMPGHSGRAPLGETELYRLDTTETSCTDNLYAPESGILKAQILYARSMGSAACIFLHNGSTQGVHAMLEMGLRDGDTVILPRNAHLSAQSACILAGLRAVWIPLSMTEDGYPYIRPEDVLRTMKQTPEAKCILLTRPDYYGGCIPLETIAQEAHAMKMRLVIDEAHGAHLHYLHDFPDAGASGADVWVQSVHKTLPALTGSAVLHLADPDDLPRAMEVIRREQTSSPSFLLMRSVDDARAYMETQGRDHLARVCAEGEHLRRKLPQWGYADPTERWQEITGYRFDPLHVVIEAPQGGRALMRALEAAGADPEMADDRRVVLLYGAGTPVEIMEKMEDLLEAMPACRAPARMFPDPGPCPPCVLSMREAALADRAWVRWSEAEGRVCAQAFGLYPPGIPLCMPGERITREILLRVGAVPPQDRFGMKGEYVQCVEPSYLTLTGH